MYTHYAAVQQVLCKTAVFIRLFYVQKINMFYTLLLQDMLWFRTVIDSGFFLLKHVFKNKLYLICRDERIYVIHTSLLGVST